MLGISVVQLQRLTEALREVDHVADAAERDPEVPDSLCGLLDLLRELTGAAAVALDLHGDGARPSRWTSPPMTAGSPASGEERGAPESAGRAAGTTHPISDTSGRSLGTLTVVGPSPEGPSAALAGIVATFLGARLEAAATRRRVTEQIELQRRLEASEARLRASERAAGVGSWELDVGTHRVLSGDALHQMLGVEGSASSPLDRYLDLVHPDDRDAIDRAIIDTSARGVPLSLRVRVTRGDGVERTLAVLGEPRAEPDGRVRSIIGTVRDITDEVAEQERLRRAQRLESIGSLAGGLAHDLNNFLTVLAGHAELLAESASPSQAASVAAIVRASDRAAALTRQLLEVGRAEVLQPRTFDVDALLETERATIRQVLPGAVDLHWELAGDLPPVRMDPTKFEQVLLNVVLNAGDAVGLSGAVTIRTAVRRPVDGDGAAAPGAASTSSARADLVCVSVEDTGPGMQPAVLARAFEPFFTTKPRDRGTGLGLSTSRSIMEQSGGHLEIDSEPGRGTTVRVLLPVSDEPLRQDGIRTHEHASSSTAELPD